jgi:MFS family permease
MTWLIISRAVQGIGGGGIIQLVIITMSDIVTLEQKVPVPLLDSHILILFVLGVASSEGSLVLPLE